MIPRWTGLEKEKLDFIKQKYNEAIREKDPFSKKHRHFYLAAFMLFPEIVEEIETYWEETGKLGGDICFD